MEDSSGWANLSARGGEGPALQETLAKSLHSYGEVLTHSLREVLKRAGGWIMCQRPMTWPAGTLAGLRVLTLL